MIRQSRYWHRQNRKKAQFERHYARKFTKALYSQIQGLMQKFDMMQMPEDLVRAVDTTFSAKEIVPAYKDLYRRVVPEFMRDQANEIRNQGKKGLLLLKNAGINGDPEQIELMWMSMVDRFIDQNVAQDIVTIVQTQRKRAIAIIQQITREALEEGLTIPETMNMLKEQLPVRWRKEQWQAERIARTEVLKAANEGNLRMAKATGNVSYKQWVTRLDGRERDAHFAAHMQTVGVNDQFMVGGEYMQCPGKGSAQNVINCRCAVYYWVDLPR